MKGKSRLDFSSPSNARRSLQLQRTVDALIAIFPSFHYDILLLKVRAKVRCANPFLDCNKMQRHARGNAARAAVEYGVLRADLAELEAVPRGLAAWRQRQAAARARLVY